MNEYKREANHHPLTFKVNQLLLGTHVCLLILFTYLKVTLMAYVNVVSILFYIVMFFFYKKNIVRYVILTLVEVLIHMSLATICLGWNAGFQFYSFCLIPCIFLCDYLAQTDHYKTMHPIAVSTVVVACFLACRGYCISCEALYILDQRIAYVILFSYNIIISFAFLTLYMRIFEKNILHKERLLENMAENDELTKLPNRYLMQRWLTESFQKASGKTKAPMAIAMLDVDNFKNLNDNYGHDCGDFVLLSLASRIQTHIDDSIHVARWGGEEFLFLDTNEHALEHLLHCLEALQKEMETMPVSFQNEQITVTITAGVTVYTEKDSTFFDIIKRADEYMYQGKNSGKNQVVSTNITK